MACKASNASFIRAITKRGYAAVAQPRPLGTPADVQTTVLENKIVVANAESTLPVSRVSVVFRAGSRNETYEEQGASHLLRIAGSLTNKNSTGFAVTRNLQQIGASLTVTSDREVVSYTVESTADKTQTALKYLLDVIQPAFKPWEIQDSISLVKTQVQAVPPQVRAVELLHKAAFRSGLGNSIYIPKFQIGKLSSETLQHFYTRNTSGSRAAIVGVGIDHNSLVGFAQRIELCHSEAKDEPANYYGGDERKDTPGDMAYVAVAGSGGALNNQKEALAFAVLQQALGASVVTKRGKANGSLAQAIYAASGDKSVGFSVLNASYLDAGLFGFVLSADTCDVCKIVVEATKALKSGAVNAEDINRGKALLKSAILENYATDSSLLTEIGLQAVLTRKVESADALVAAVDAITQQDVQNAAKKVSSSALSVGAVGDLSSVPYASDLN